MIQHSTKQPLRGHNISQIENASRLTYHCGTVSQMIVFVSSCGWSCKERRVNVVTWHSLDEISHAKPTPSLVRLAPDPTEM
jgi:hypothetical protein